MLGLLISLLVKMGLMILPLTVFCLAGRRLFLSRSANAWLYAATAGFAWVTALGLTPWTFGFGTTHPVFFVFAAMTPAIWYSVATLCNASRHLSYDSEMERTFLRLAAIVRQKTKPAPLILEGADWPDAPKPVFRHTASEPAPEHEPEAPAPQRPVAPQAAKLHQAASDATGRILEVTRTMRRNRTSEDRRIKLLPPPDKAGKSNLPFLNPASSV
ncbi:MAG: hypothetical protein HKM96_04875 [Boseongicola sp.]|nr:hypothetical protein [Boseongicola sp.]